MYAGTTERPSSGLCVKTVHMKVSQLLDLSYRDLSAEALCIIISTRSRLLVRTTSYSS